MSVMETLRVRGPWTVADLEGLPDDNHRYELIDGVLLVNAAPRPDHQGVVVMLWKRLVEAAPPDLRVLVAPVDVVLANDTVVEPDIVVAPRSAYTDKFLSAPPLLAVEVLSPSTQVVDRNLKKDRYAREGFANYWLVDPDELTLTAYELRGGRYVVAASVGPDQTWTAASPFPVTITPRDLRY